jgi:hypothetical protein
LILVPARSPLSETSFTRAAKPVIVSPAKPKFLAAIVPRDIAATISLCEVAMLSPSLTMVELKFSIFSRGMSA